MPNCGSQIVVPDRGKNIDYDRRFERGGLVFDSTAPTKLSPAPISNVSAPQVTRSRPETT